MKKFYLFVAMATLAIGFNSCSDDDIAPLNPNQNSSLVGDWVLTSLVSDVALDLDLDAAADTEIMNETDCFDDMQITFNADDTFSSTVTEIKFEGVNQDMLTCTDSVQTGTFSFNGSVLTITLNVAGGTVTEDQTINLQTNTLQITVTSADVAQFFSNPGNNPAANVNQLIFTYTKI